MGDRALAVYGHATDDWVELKTTFLLMGQGYYVHQHLYEPQWEGMESFRGTIARPQAWPEGLEYTKKNVLVIDSGATAGAVIPAMVEHVNYVTMLQCTPSYYIPRPVPHEFAQTLSSLDLLDSQALHLFADGLLN